MACISNQLILKDNLQAACATSKEPSPEIWLWYTMLVSISITNIVVYIYLIFKAYTTSFAEIPNVNVKRYRLWMLWLAGPYVLQCAVRSYYPEIYNQRITFWDTPLNSIFLGRFLATIGEVTWIAQIAYGIIFCHQQILIIKGSKDGIDLLTETLIKIFSILSILLCSIAELFCNHATITLNYFGNVIETSLWFVAIFLVVPCSFYLLKAILNLQNAKIDKKRAVFFFLMLFLLSIIFLIQLAFDHIPLQFRLWQEQKAKSYKFVDLWTGLRSSLNDRIPSQSWEDWKDDWFWMFAYFSAGVWTSLFMATAPRLYSLQDSKIKEVSKTVSKDKKKD